MAKVKKDKNGLVVTYDKDRVSIVKGDSWVYTDSLNLADVLGTEHKKVLERIRNVLTDYKIEDGTLNRPSSESTEIQEFIHKHTDFTYAVNHYKNSQNKLQPYYKLSKDLLILVVFSFRKLEKAQEIQLAYIAKFNAMEKELNWYNARYLGIVTRNYMTDCIKDYYDGTRSRENPYVAFTNLVYMTVFGHDASKLRMIHKLPKGENIRPWLSDEDVKIVDKMEQEVGTLISYGIELKVIRSMIGKKHGSNGKRELVLLSEKRK